MEYRKNCGSPRDMVDDALLAQLLGESEMSCRQYGTASQRRSGNSCGCRSRQMNMNTGMSYHMPCREPMQNMEDKENTQDCGCGEHEDCAVKNCLTGYHLAMSYTPDHEWENLHDVEEALGHGTIFKGLDFPFYPACKSCK